jgi:hypothetical protein
MQDRRKRRKDAESSMRGSEGRWAFEDEDFRIDD